MCFGSSGDGATENVVTLGSSGAPPHTASWKDRITCWKSGLPSLARSFKDCQLGGSAGYPSDGGLSSPGTDTYFELNGGSGWPANSDS